MNANKFTASSKHLAFETIFCKWMYQKLIFEIQISDWIQHFITVLINFGIKISSKIKIETAVVVQFWTSKHVMV